MKTSKILWLLSAILCLASCSNDDTEYNVLDTQKVSLAEDFVDERDGRVYKCVKIGNQIWMAENLGYYIPGGQLEGCYTWNESDIDVEKMEEELANMKELSSDKWCQLCDDLFNEFKGSWEAMGEADEWALDDFVYWDIYDLQHGWQSFEDVDRKAQQFPVFYAMLQERISALVKTKEQLIKEHTDAAEAANGSYSKDYGFLYTLDGAKAAVPEGWRIPSDEDWKKLEAALGMSADLDVMNAWRGTNAGDYLKVGGEAKFNAIYTGCNAWVFNKDKYGYYVNRDYSAYFWCSDETTRTETETPEEGETDEDGNLKEEESYEVREGIVRQVSIYSSKIWRGVTRLDKVCYSVRCVKDAN